MKKLALALLICLLVLGLPLQGQIFEGGFAGALSGAMLGSLVGGRPGAAWGAAIGGGVGMIEGANERDRQNQAQAAFRRQQQERAAWQREDQRRREHERALLAARQECCLPTSAPAAHYPANMAPAGNSFIVLETKKSLLRMGYDPGAIDNQMNPQTAEAIKAYEVKYSLLITGRPTEELLRHMLQHGG
ncbi:MAG: peptidoglycan-binding domain-containing protein [Candidatus Acidiferrum sp.]